MANVTWPIRPLVDLYLRRNPDAGDHRTRETLGLSHDQWTGYETGHYEPWFSDEKAERLCHELDVEPSTLWPDWYDAAAMFDPIIEFGTAARRINNGSLLARPIAPIPGQTSMFDEVA